MDGMCLPISRLEQSLEIVLYVLHGIEALYIYTVSVGAHVGMSVITLAKAHHLVFYVFAK